MSDKGDNKKEDAKLLPMVEQQTSQEDASGNDDQNRFYSSSAELLDANSSSKLETKGPEGREVKKSRADISPSSDHFSGVFSGTKYGVSQVLGKLLNGESLRNLNQVVNRGAQRVYGEAAYKALIKEEIGPNLQQLIQPGEDARAAYFRHRNIIRDLPFVNTELELASRIDNYPHYYFNRIVTDANFRYLFRNNVSTLSTAVRGPLARYTNQIVGRILASDVLFSVIFSRVGDLVNFQRGFPSPEFVGQVVEKVLAEDKHFVRIISSIKMLEIFLRRFSTCAIRVAEKMLADDRHFIRIICSPGFYLERFKEIFPAAYVNRAVEKVLAEDKHFARLISSIDDLEGFQEAFPTYAFRAELLFKVKQQARQEEAKSIGSSTSGQSNKSAFSSVGGPSMFASGSSITTNSPQGQPPVLEAKEEASERSEGSNFSASTPAAGLPAGDNGGASRQESSEASSGNLPSGDNDKNEGTGRNPPPSPRGG